MGHPPKEAALVAEFASEAFHALVKYLVEVLGSFLSAGVSPSEVHDVPSVAKYVDGAVNAADVYKDTVGAACAVNKLAHEELAHIRRRTREVGRRGLWLSVSGTSSGRIARPCGSSSR